MSVWAAIAGMGLVTLALRAAFLLLPAHIDLPAVARRALPFVPAAVLTALWAPELLLANGVVHLALDNERLLAGAVALVVAWRWRLTFATIGSGLAALHFFDWLP